VRVVEEEEKEREEEEEEEEEEEKAREGLKTGGAHIKNTRPIRRKEREE